MVSLDLNYSLFIELNQVNMFCLLRVLTAPADNTQNALIQAGETFYFLNFWPFPFKEKVAKYNFLHWS